MKHDWRDNTRPGPAAILDGPRRKCAHCGAEQERERQTWYMRTVGYRWLPLAGRCPGKNKGVKVG